jgi:hypothetical protein
MPRRTADDTTRYLDTIAHGCNVHLLRERIAAEADDLDTDAAAAFLAPLLAAYEASLLRQADEGSTDPLAVDAKRADDAAHAPATASASDPAV